MSRFDTTQRIRQLLEDEKGGFRKPFGSGYAFGIVYPNSYHVGMSNLGIQIAYGLVNSHPDWSCERFFMDFEPVLSMENCRPPSDFHFLGFSVSSELDYVNVLDFLARAHIPLRAADRGPEYPLILGAGICIDVNRLPLYDYVDVFVNGDAEDLVPLFLRIFEEHGDNRTGLLAALASEAGFEATAGACEVYGVEAPPIDEHRPPPLVRRPISDVSELAGVSQIVTSNTEFADMCLIEAARGCPYRCTFCHVGHNLHPYREQGYERIVAWIEQRREWTDKFGFVGSAVASHPEMDRLCSYCDEAGLKISFASLRAEDVTPVMIRSLARSGTQTLTIAPEAGSHRLRRLLGKASLTDERVADLIEQATIAGIPNLKLYFMVGLPTETEEDILAITELVRSVQELLVKVSRPRGRIGSISVNVGVYVPKQRTPLARLPQIGWDQTERHVALLEKHLRKISNVKFQLTGVHLAQVQAILSNSDLRSGKFLMMAHRYGGKWKRALREWGQP